MQLQAFSAKIQIRCPHLLHYTGTSTTSQVTSSPETPLFEDQVTSFPNPQTKGSPPPFFPDRPPPPHARHLGEKEETHPSDHSWTTGS